MMPDMLDLCALLYNFPSFIQFHKMYYMYSCCSVSQLNLSCRLYHWDGCHCLLAKRCQNCLLWHFLQSWWLLANKTEQYDITCDYWTVVRFKYIPNMLPQKSVSFLLSAFKVYGEKWNVNAGALIKKRLSSHIVIIFSVEKFCKPLKSKADSSPHTEHSGFPLDQCTDFIWRSWHRVVSAGRQRVCGTTQTRTQEDW